MDVIHGILAVAHVLAGAAWFGAMFYSYAVLHPRARSFFRNPQQFEDFITHIAAGARWKVLGGAAFILVTGLSLMLYPVDGALSHWKLGLRITKAILFVVAVGLFCFTSWVLWPARVMATAQELPKFHQRFRIIALALLVLIGGSLAIGAISSHLIR